MRLVSGWLAVSLCLVFCVARGQLQLQREPNRTFDLWNPFGTTTTRKPGEEARRDEVIVRLPIGDLVGKKFTLTDLPWTVNHDPVEVTSPERGMADPNPVPPLNNVTIFTFLGVPYAEPPISERRFKPPQQLIQFPGESPYVAFDYKPSCSQDVEARPSLFINDLYPFRVNEDCLYLNIYTPEASRASNLFYPVVLFLHGGNFQTGSGNEWPGHVLASRGLVVVTVNYRLGAFGFMSLGDAVTGNYGIQDQRLAMQWVQQNIAAFGGDPQAVTVVGHDAGAVSAGVHMLAPLSRGLFRGVAALSGAEVSYHSIIGKPALAFNNTLKLGRYLGCVQAVAQNVWDCIKQRSSEDILAAMTPAANPPIPIEYNRYLFMPTVDGRELKAHPLWLLNNVPSGAADLPSPVPYLTGLNQHDGAEVILEDRTLGEFTDFLQVTHEYQRSFVYEYSFRHNYTMNREAIAEAIDSYYTFWPDPADTWMIRDKFIELTTDAYYTAPVSLSAHLHSATGSRTFMYVNSYNFSRIRDNRLGAPTNGAGQKAFPTWMGSCHECDLYLLFGFPFLPKHLLPPRFRDVEWYDTDRNASQVFGSFVRRFVQNSDPNFPYDGTWSALQPRAHWYLDFNYTEGAGIFTPGVLKRDYRYESVAFWNNYIPALVNYMTTTFPPWEVRERREVVTYTILVIVLAVLLVLAVVIALSFAYCLWGNKDGNEVEHRQLVRLQEYPSTSHVGSSRTRINSPVSGRIDMQKLSSL